MMIERLLASVLVVSDHDRRQPQIMKQEQAINNSKDKADALRHVCPECQHVFKGSNWGGIDAHWHAHHEDMMRYEDAWPLIKAGRYPPARATAPRS